MNSRQERATALLFCIMAVIGLSFFGLYWTLDRQTERLDRLEALLVEAAHASAPEAGCKTIPELLTTKESPPHD